MPYSKEIFFRVSSIECIACTPVFKRELSKLQGVKKVTTFVMTNTIRVEIDPDVIATDAVKKEILRIATTSGLDKRVTFSYGHKVLDNKRSDRMA